MATIIKITDDRDGKEYYMEWSSRLDAPKTYGVSLDEFKVYYRAMYGKDGLDGLSKKLERVEEKGTSEYARSSVEEHFEYNRAGENEETLDKVGIIEKYCINE